MTTSTALPAAPRTRLTRRQRRRVSLDVQYAVFVAVLVVLALLADWTSLRQHFAQGDVAREMFPDVLTTALRNTVVDTLTGFASGLLLGVVLALPGTQVPGGTVGKVALDSSLVLFLGVQLGERELTKFGSDLASTKANIPPPILVAGLCYRVITGPLSYLARRLEARNAKATA